jgi:hypothetical protein
MLMIRCLAHYRSIIDIVKDSSCWTNFGIVFALSLLLGNDEMPILAEHYPHEYDTLHCKGIARFFKPLQSLCPPMNRPLNTQTTHQVNPSLTSISNNANIELNGRVESLSTTFVAVGSGPRVDCPGSPANTQHKLIKTAIDISVMRLNR